MLKRINWIVLFFCIGMSIWQLVRFLEKKSLVSLANDRIQVVKQLSEIDHLDNFLLVSLEEPLNFDYIIKVKQSYHGQPVTHIYVLIWFDNSYLPVQIECKYGNSVFKTHNNLWLTRVLPSRKIYVHLISGILVNDFLPFLDKNLIERKFGVKVHDYYLQMVPEKITTDSIFAFDFSRSDLLFKTANKEINPCYPRIAPPELHLSYVFEWLVLGFLGFGILSLVMRKVLVF